MGKFKKKIVSKLINDTGGADCKQRSKRSYFSMKEETYPLFMPSLELVSDKVKVAINTPKESKVPGPDKKHLEFLTMNLLNS